MESYVVVAIFLFFIEGVLYLYQLTIASKCLEDVRNKVRISIKCEKVSLGFICPKNGGQKSGLPKTDISP
jgi:hypothetical protein